MAKSKSIDKQCIITKYMYAMKYKYKKNDKKTQHLYVA